MCFWEFCDLQMAGDEFTSFLYCSLHCVQSNSFSKQFNGKKNQFFSVLKYGHWLFWMQLWEHYLIVSIYRSVSIKPKWGLGTSYGIWPLPASGTPTKRTENPDWTVQVRTTVLPTSQATVLSTGVTRITGISLGASCSLNLCRTVMFSFVGSSVILHS